MRHWAWAMMAVSVGMMGCTSMDQLDDSRSQQRPDIDAILDGFHASASRADYEAYFSVWEPNSVFLGTDASERWVGDEFKAFARPYFEKGKGWTYEPRQRVWTMINPEAMQFDELLTNDKLGMCRGSGVLVRRDGQWKVLQYNLSIPVPNEIADKVAEQIRAHQPVQR